MKGRLRLTGRVAEERKKVKHYAKTCTEINERLITNRNDKRVQASRHFDGIVVLTQD